MRGMRHSVAVFFAILVFTICLSPVLTVRCGGANPVISIADPPEKDEQSIRDMVLAVNENLAGKGFSFEFLEYSKSGSVVSIELNMADYKGLGQIKKQNLMQVTLDTVLGSGVSRTNKNKIYNFISEEDITVSSLVRQLSNDVKADFGGAYSSYFKPFSGKIGILLGILAFGIMTCLGLTIVVDIAYITIPGFQWFCQSSTKRKKPRFASLEACNAVQEAESKVGSGDYVNPLTVYLGTKTKQYIAISICLLYLVSGQLYGFIADFMDYFQGLLR